jgi:hypothetical protein
MKLVICILIIAFTSQQSETNSTNFIAENKNDNIIRKVYAQSPLIGEILALANINGIELIINSIFVEKEKNVLKKYLTMLEVSNINLEYTATVLLNIILTNSILRTNLINLIDGLYELDERNLSILTELISTVLVDSIISTRFMLYQDIKAKDELVKIFNKEYKIKSVNKLQFVQKLRLDESSRDGIIAMIMNYKTNADVETAKTKSNYISNPFEGTIAVRKINLMSREEAKQLIQDLRFKQGGKTNKDEYSLPKYFEYESYDLNKGQEVILAEVKSIIFNDTLIDNFKMNNLEENGVVQIGISGRTVYSKLFSHIDSLLKLNCILNKFPFDTLPGSINVAGNVMAHQQFRFKTDNDTTIPSNDFIKQQLLSNPEIAKHLNNATILFPDHIEQLFEAPKIVNKNIQVNTNSNNHLNYRSDQTTCNR